MTDLGRTWTRESRIVIQGLSSTLKHVDPDVIRLADGRYRVFFTVPPNAFRFLNTYIASAISTDGRSFTLEPEARAPSAGPTSIRADADVVLLADGTYRMYFAEVTDGNAQPVVNDIRSAKSN